MKNSFKNYMFSKLPNFNEILELHEIMYLASLFDTYQRLELAEIVYKNNDIKERKIIAQQLLDNAITVFANAKQNSIQKSTTRVMHK